MDPGKRSNYDVKVLQNHDKLMSVDGIKQVLSDTLDSQIGEVGYICPGHGMKGKKHTLQDDDDVQEMYDSVYRGKYHILLWCYLTSVTSVSKQHTTGKKRKLGDDCDSASSQSKRTAAQKKIDEVEDIVSKLRENHGNSFKIEHLNAWAHLIHIGKHSSYDTPPNYPYFVGRKSFHTSSKDNPESDLASNPGKSDLSPGKRVQLRSQCIDQLSRWHTLKQDGGITAQEYEQLRKNIISDIGKF